MGSFIFDSTLEFIWVSSHLQYISFTMGYNMNAKNQNLMNLSSVLDKVISFSKMQYFRPIFMDKFVLVMFFLLRRSDF